MEWGLLMVAGGWMIVSASLAFEFGVVYHNTLLAFCWVYNVRFVNVVVGWGCEKVSI